MRASSGEEALRCLLERDFAVILLDVQMPGINGFETARLIKSRERTRYIPIIFLTAISKEAEYVFRGYSVGAVDYMFKPFQPEILRSKVQVFVELYLQQRRLARAGTAAARNRAAGARAAPHARAVPVRGALQRDRRLGDGRDRLFDAEGTISLFNGAAERMFGTTAADAIGTSIT